MTGTRHTRWSSSGFGTIGDMSHDFFTAGYLAASDRAADELISRTDVPVEESERWCPPHLHGDAASTWREGFESWWEPR